MGMLYVILLVLLIIIGFMFIKQYFHVMNVESFDDFSPYSGNQSYPFVYQKNQDQQMLRKTLRQWEQPFNCNDEGYYNAEPKGIPPMVPISSYVDLQHKKFLFPPKGCKTLNWL
jgi:hypothetical protein